MSATPLITTAEALAALPTFSAVASGEQTALIDAATAAINRYTDRVFGTASYIDKHYPGRTRFIRIAQFPVTALTLSADLTSVLTIQYTGTALRATAAYTYTGSPGAEVYTGLVLTVGGTTVGTLLFATYQTVASVAAAIADLSGWTATVAKGYELWATADLLMGIGVKGAVATPLNLGALTRDLDFDLDEKTGRVTLNESFSDHFRYPDHAGNGFGSWLGCGLVTSRELYAMVLSRSTCGYATADVPADLKQAATATVQFFNERRNVSGVFKSLSSGKSSYTLNDYLHHPLPDYVCAMLASYRRCDLA